MTTPGGAIAFQAPSSRFGWSGGVQGVQHSLTTCCTPDGQAVGHGVQRDCATGVDHWSDRFAQAAQRKGLELLRSPATDQGGSTPVEHSLCNRVQIGLVQILSPTGQK